MSIHASIASLPAFTVELKTRPMLNVSSSSGELPETGSPLTTGWSRYNGRPLNPPTTPARVYSAAVTSSGFGAFIA
jgi:hypothetical protein